MKKRKIVLTVLLAFVILTAGTAIFAFKEYNRKNDSLKNTKADYAQTAIGLINEFTNDETKANTVYTGKVIALSSLVKSVDKDDKGMFTIVLGDPEALSSVRCSIDSTNSSEASLVKAGASIQIKGICTGYNADEMGLGADVILNRCVIVKQ